MGVKVVGYQLHILNMRTRMPFRYGIAEMTALPHLFASAELSIDGERIHGVAADHLPPKWFTKDPSTDFRQEVADMLSVIEHAFESSMQMDESGIFTLWQRLYLEQLAWAQPQKIPPLLAGFGVSLVERALIDGFCRHSGVNFATAARTNMFKMRLGAVHEELLGAEPAMFMPSGPLRTIIARHTVGLSDPLTAEDVEESERVDDGLPQTLEECIDAYGLSHFKIKLSGKVDHDVERLARIIELIDRMKRGDFVFTLDGNEQFGSVADFQVAWDAITAEPRLRPFLRHILFVEQPLHRDAALGAETSWKLNTWTERPPMIIDESDAVLSSATTALASGYCGTSHKNCKGVLKGLANLCLLEHRRRQDPRGRYLLSGEDLTTVGPISLLQDLSAMACFGVRHVERNGHHYFKGLSALPEPIQQDVLGAHKDLYYRHERGFATLAIKDGVIQVGSVVDAPFGCALDIDTSSFTPVDRWSFESLNV